MEPISETEKKFKQTVLSHVAKVQNYKDESLLEKAQQVIPVEELTIRATQNLSKLDNVEGEDCVSLDDLVLMELMLWFKKDFFSWVDAPSCDACGGNTVANAQSQLQPTLQESQWDAHRVEGYRCVLCGHEVRFPRYNHPGKLLEERRGRCGEWANCFALLVYAIGREARLAFDFNDHVWVEVYSTDREEWLHVDPCESAYDTPLLYEKGWKKPVAHVIGFSAWEVQDVTWRYTSDFAAVMERRRNKQCREEYVEDLIWSVNEKLLSGLPTKERSERLDRMFGELMQFLTPRKEDGSNYGGRTSGSLAWRMARGETGGDTQRGYVFHLSPRDVENKLFQMKYNCAGDKYFQMDNSVIEGWENGVFKHSNIFRKREMDWKQVYLCRTEGSDQGFLEWKFDFSDSGLTIDQVTLNMHHQTYETGRIKVHTWPGLQKIGQGLSFDFDMESSLTQHLQGHSGFILRMELSGGNGQVAWQHAQLFRQDLADFQACPFQLNVTFSAKGKS